MSSDPSNEAALRDPIERLQAALLRARATEPFDATAVALATASAAGAPSVRMVLCRGVGPEGLVFHTNRGSRKAHDIEENGRGALCFHWPTLKEQVRVEGSIVRLPDDESDAYFATRPRGHQLGAWASRQSAPIAGRAELEEATRAVTARFEGQPVPRPPFWGGYRLIPSVLEFWRDREDRLHDRTVYTRDAGGPWAVARLSP